MENDEVRWSGAELVSVCIRGELFVSAEFGADDTPSSHFFGGHAATIIVDLATAVGLTFCHPTTNTYYHAKTTR